MLHSFLYFSLKYIFLTSALRYTEKQLVAGILHKFVIANLILLLSEISSRKFCICKTETPIKRYLVKSCLLHITKTYWKLYLWKKCLLIKMHVYNLQFTKKIWKKLFAVVFVTHFQQNTPQWLLPTKIASVCYRL